MPTSWNDYEVEALEKIAYRRGWNEAIEAAAQIASEAKHGDNPAAVERGRAVRELRRRD